jgi:hypothetical protein
VKDMTLKQAMLLAVPAIALCALGALALRLSVDLDERARSDSIAGFVSGALDDPSKLTPSHVQMVIRAARTIEEAGRRGEVALAASIAGIARSCFLLAAMSAVFIAIVAWQQSALRAGAADGRSGSR